MSLAKLRRDILKIANQQKAKELQRFFKTGKGEYGEGDLFLGITVPKSRVLAKKYFCLSTTEIQELLNSKNHEDRLIALLILIEKFEKNKEERKMIFKLYLKNTGSINNWDLVDLSAPRIVGAYLFDKEKKILYKLAKSKKTWERRIAILSTFYFIRGGQFDDTIKISEILLSDKEDLIHKAVGWMLREVGKRDKNVEVKFLKKYCRVMPRTMLRYAIEKFDEKTRRRYLDNKYVG
jgi:3-methyladenine DNA glycosylase AlkD